MSWLALITAALVGFVLGRIRVQRETTPKWQKAYRNSQLAVQRHADRANRAEHALRMIRDRTYPATYVGRFDGVERYGKPEDASNYARRILNGEQVT